MEIKISNANDYSVNQILFDINNPNLNFLITNTDGVTVSFDDDSTGEKMKDFMKHIKNGNDFNFKSIEWSCDRIGDGEGIFIGNLNKIFTIIKSDPNHNFYGQSIQVVNYITATQIEIYPIVIPFVKDANFHAIPLKNTVINKIDSNTNYLLEIVPKSTITLKFIK